MTTQQEVTKQWATLTEGEINQCLAAHATAFGLSYKNPRHMQTMKRIFDLGNPNIVFGTSENGSSYCRVASESVDVMKVITRQYL